MGYEFTNKEIRAEFKATELGKKLNTLLYTSLLFGIIGGFVLVFNLFANNPIGGEYVEVITPLAFLAVIISCYFDGKRDGAIAQFQISRETKKKTQETKKKKWPFNIKGSKR